MPAPSDYPSLPDRWIAAASADPSADRALLQLVERCRTGASINEAALLNAIVHHAEEIAATDMTAAVADSGPGEVSQ